MTRQGTRFEATFSRLAQEGKTALMPYITAGDPNLEGTERLVDHLIESGADMIELGVPYSDPLADGPTVQAAGQRALESGTTVEGIFQLVERLRTRHADTPIALLVYYNCIFRWGEERFVRQAKESGVDAFVVPDLPPEEATSLQNHADQYGVDLAYLLAPTSTKERIQRITSQARGFIYCVSLTGVTGARAQISDQLSPFMQRVRTGLAEQGRKVPLAVGFGISTPEHVERVAKMADGVIVGSALIDTLHQGDSLDDGIKACGNLIAAMRRTLDTMEAKDVSRSVL